MKILITVLLCLFMCLNLYAKKGPVTKLELPRFVSLKSNDVNLRVGPSVNYPIKIKYIQNNLPVEIIDEFDVWRKVKDHENNIGWVHKSLIKGERFILPINIKENIKNIYDKPNGKIIGIVKNYNILSLERCLINWCYISHKSIKGWISKNFIWGVYKDEIYNKPFYQPIINQYWKILETKFF
ncbi:SH3 domain-containing protein [Pelagibacteraceae bacterium]|nr:SH3 domain-containing protein [Pelagibacteraceae bacterium]